MRLLTEFRFNFVKISYSGQQTQYLSEVKYNKNMVYGCDSGIQKIFCEF
jgi:hypothetical protein